MKTIFVLVESRQQFDFFIRFKEGLKELDIEYKIITDKLSIYVESKIRFKVTSILISYSDDYIETPNLNLTVEICLNSLTIKQARKLYNAFYSNAEKLITTHAEIIFFIWSGFTVASTAIQDIAFKYNIPALYFERSGFPGRYFVDPWGTNIKSYLYKNVFMLDKKDNFGIDIDTRDINNISGSFKKVSFRLNYLFILDVVYSYLAKLPFRGEINPIKKIFFYYYPRYSLYVHKYYLESCDYIFIALSHSLEIKKQGFDVEWLEKKVTHIYSLAVTRDMPVLIKFHPEEDNTEFIACIVKLRNENKVIIVGEDTNKIIDGASEVYLFNTSVALEVIKKNKKYHFVQQSLYDQFNSHRVEIYQNNFLIKSIVDIKGYFSLETIKSMLARLTIPNS